MERSVSIRHALQLGVTTHHFFSIRIWEYCIWHALRQVGLAINRLSRLGRSMNEGVFIRCIQDIQSIHIQTTPTSAALSVMLLLRIRDGAGRRVGLTESRRDTAAMLQG